MRLPKTMLMALNEGLQGHYAPYTVRQADTLGAPYPHHLRNGVFDFLLGKGEAAEVDGQLARHFNLGKPPQRAPLFRFHARHSKARFGFRERLLNVRGVRMKIMKALKQSLEERRNGG